MKKRVFIYKRDFIRICVFLKHIELSIHRRENNEDVKMKSYLLNNKELLDNLLTVQMRKKNIRDFFIEENILFESEINLIEYLLEDVKLYVNGASFDDKKIMFLRVNLKNIYKTISKRLSNKINKEINRIEHYNQNEILETVSLDVFLQNHRCS